MPTVGASLWKQPDFVALWLSQALARIGAQVSLLALPLAAVIGLDATPAQMGLLAAIGALPPLIASDLGTAVVLAVVPIAWMFGLLSMNLLYVVAALTGALGIVSASPMADTTRPRPSSATYAFTSALVSR